MQSSMTSAKIRAQNRIIKRRLMRKYWQMYLLLSLPIIYLLIFKYYPMLGVQIAFKDFKAALGIWGSPWIGFTHFKKFFVSPQFSRIVPNTIILSFYALLAGFPVPILLALSINTVQSNSFKKSVQMITYIPHFISVVVIVGMLMSVMDPRTGIFGVLYSAVTGGKILPNFFGSPGAFRHLYVWSGIWQGMGYSSIIYFAALSSVDQELHEAAQIDGASRLQRVIHIDVPSILPTAIILLIMNSGRIMSVGFEKAFLMQNMLNLRSSEVISTYVYKVSLTAGGSDFSYGAAVGLFNAIVNLMMLWSVNAVSRKLQSVSLW